MKVKVAESSEALLGFAALQFPRKGSGPEPAPHPRGSAVLVGLCPGCPRAAGGNGLNGGNISPHLHLQSTQLVKSKASTIS